MTQSGARPAQRIAITGSSGMIGTALIQHLTARGDEVVKLVRHAPGAADEVQWDPAKAELDEADLRGVTAAVNLAGAGIGDHRWTAAYKRTITDSRVSSTATLAHVLTSLEAPVHLVSASGMSYYGERGDDVVDESGAPGDSFLAGVTQVWEAATAPAAAAGHPVCFLRTSLVLDPHGGSMEQVLRLAKLGLGGPLGSGRQWWSWISLEDQVRAIVHLIDHPEITGPVNMSSPSPARQADFMQALGRALHRPAVLPAPSFALRAVLGELASEIMTSLRMQPKVLQDSGFTWVHNDLAEVADWLAR
ncbi:TIGR01777 family oxidoreductase [Allobranchiibius sp. CTAmp26]|uniref:TIGR01777 family oxidoreductase n=1 Tax=Allobranchiibius sp. CTAmp26 TaxID=2815214 RepID=UPI001AA0B88F|nr:TIGR01777 family oxidoreductase [Allobranchiibius sp. CTAmp26]MBO1755294.1 TIGR01777 family oxidoreductase [Allobranchiibius sp. CTAmp26]